MNKKLTLNKVNIASLDRGAMTKIMGGFTQLYPETGCYPHTQRPVHTDCYPYDSVFMCPKNGAS